MLATCQHRGKYLLATRQIFLLCLALSIITTSCSIELDTKVTLTDANLPPSFKLSGTGSSPIFLMGGPFSDIHDTTQGLRLWEIVAGQEINEQPVWQLPQITYGKIPNGFVQRYPEQGTPPPLEEGKYYFIFVHVNGARPGKMCLTIRDNKAVEIERN